MDGGDITTRKPHPVNTDLRTIALLIVALVCSCLSAALADHRPAADKLARLGSQLFMDKRLSADGTVSCTTCHDPYRAFSDGLPVAQGLGGQRGTRNTPSLWNSEALPALFWDGRRTTLEEQALDPLFNAKEHGLRDEAALLLLLRTDKTYVRAFKELFGGCTDCLQPNQVGLALAAFIRTLRSDNSAFDQHWTSQNPRSFSPAANRGLELFVGRAGCSECHVVTAKDRSFTDHQFHSLGIGIDAILPRLAEIAQRAMNLNDRELDQLVTQDPDFASLGRFVVTRDPRDIGKFRTPSLRNVALTAPYMHDGSVATLREAIESEIYYRSLEKGRPLILTPREQSDVEAFLESLTSGNARAYPAGLEASN